ncbi:MAG: glycoside hydrolase domain-containing protein, partial [Promethearchaeota archaeon]
VVANVDNNCIFYLANDLSRVDKNFIPNYGHYGPSTVNNTVDLYAAKNEYEPLQIVMRLLNIMHFSLYDIEFSGFTHVNTGDVIGPENLEMYFVEYDEALAGKVPDKLVKFYPKIFTKSQNYPLWFTFFVPLNATEGDYTGTLTISHDKFLGSTFKFNPYGNPSFEINIRLHVFNFSLPEVPTLKSNFGFYPSRSAFDNIMQEFKAHRMMHWTIIDVPKFNVTNDGHVASLNFTEMDEQIEKAHSYGTYTLGVHPFRYSVIDNSNDPFQVNGISYSCSNYTDAPEYNQTLAEYVQLLEAHLKSFTYIDPDGNNKSVFDEFYLSGFDEAGGKGDEELNYAVSEYHWYKEAGNLTLPIMQTIMNAEPALEEIVDILCYHPDAIEPEFIKKWRNDNRELWIYTTGGPRYPRPTISTSAFQIQTRALGLFCWVYNFTHYLIWDTATPYNGMDGMGYEGWNGGSLLYPMPEDEYTITARIEAIRDGFEDYEYFALLNQLKNTYKGNADYNELVQSADSLLAEIQSLVDGYDIIASNSDIDNLRLRIGQLISEFNA